MINSLYIIYGFTFLIHFTESSVYTMRLAGVRTRQIAISLSFITSALLISRLSNMGQSPLMGHLVDETIHSGTTVALDALVSIFRTNILFAFLGSLVGALIAPTTVILLQHMIKRFLKSGSFLGTVFSSFHPKNMVKIMLSLRLPRLSSFQGLSLKGIPKTFLILNIFVTSIYTIGVMCALLAGAYMPELLATSIQLSGIVNGIATILMATFVDPSGARITDQAVHGVRPESDVRSVVFYLLAGRLIGTLVVAQLVFIPFTNYIMLCTKLIAKLF